MKGATGAVLRAAGLTAVLAAVYFLFAWGPRHPTPAERFDNAPWADVIPVLAPVQNVNALRASECGACHVDHYADWRQSTHALAYHDLQFQSELAKPNSPRWLCLNCHTPLANQREILVQALRDGDIQKPITVPNPHFDSELRSEGVTCAACHVRSDSNGDSYVIGPTGGVAAPHPVRADRSFLANRCLDCHNVTHQVGPDLVCYFQTGDELAAGPYAATKTCIDCHMPRAEGPQRGVALSSGVAHRHGFIGGGVPKRYDLYPFQIAAGYRPGLRIAVDTVRCAPGARHCEVKVSVANENAGHRVTSGDPERFILLRICSLNAAGAEINCAEERYGQVWEWSPVARQISDNRIGPLERREWHARVAQSADALRVRITAEHVRLTENNARYMEQTAADAPAEYREQIRRLRSLYPMRTMFFREEFDLQSGERRRASLPQLFAEQARP